MHISVSAYESEKWTGNASATCKGTRTVIRGTYARSKRILAVDWSCHHHSSPKLIIAHTFHEDILVASREYIMISCPCAPHALAASIARTRDISRDFLGS